MEQPWKLIVLAELIAPPFRRNVPPVCVYVDELIATVPVWRSTRPELLNVACNVVVPALAVLRNVPALLTVPVNDPL